MAFKMYDKWKRRKQRMNNKIEVIGIDHGWSNIKTSSQIFVTGVKKITTEPALFDGVLEYKGKYFRFWRNFGFYYFKTVWKTMFKY